MDLRFGLDLGNKMKIRSAVEYDESVNLRKKGIIVYAVLKVRTQVHM